MLFSEKRLKKVQNIWIFRYNLLSLQRQLGGFRRKDDNLYGFLESFRAPNLQAITQT